MTAFWISRLALIVEKMSFFLLNYGDGKAIIGRERKENQEICEIEEIHHNGTDVVLVQNIWPFL